MTTINNNIMNNENNNETTAIEKRLSRAALEKMSVFGLRKYITERLELETAINKDVTETDNDGNEQKFNLRLHADCLRYCESHGLIKTTGRKSTTTETIDYEQRRATTENRISDYYGSHKTDELEIKTTNDRISFKIRDSRAFVIFAHTKNAHIAMTKDTYNDLLEYATETGASYLPKLTADGNLYDFSYGSMKVQIKNFDYDVITAVKTIEEVEKSDGTTAKREVVKDVIDGKDLFEVVRDLLVIFGAVEEVEEQPTETPTADEKPTADSDTNDKATATADKKKKSKK